jgi:hypothetical protein
MLKQKKIIILHEYCYCLLIVFVLSIDSFSSRSICYCSPPTIQPTIPTPTTANTPIAPTTNTRAGSSNAGIPLNRAAPDRKTIHNIPTRPHYSTTNASAVPSGINADHRASIRNTNTGTMNYTDMNNRHQAGAMMSGTNNGAQSFLSKLSSKFARR